MVFYFLIIVGNFLRFYNLCHKKTLRDKNINIDSALKDVNMLEYKNRLLGMLSGGQQQRVLIARALMGNPDIIILDEPSTGVDEGNQKEIYSILKKAIINQYFLILINICFYNKKSTIIFVLLLRQQQQQQ